VRRVFFRRLVVLVGAGATTACSLLTDLSGLSEPARADASGVNDGATGGVDGGLDAQPTQGDARTDADSGVAAGTYAAAVLADEPLMYLRLGEKGGAIAVDATKNANNGSLGSGHSFGVPGVIAGDPDTALRLNGVASGIDLGKRFDFVGTQPYTVEVWTKIELTDQSFRHLYKKSAEPLTGREAYGLYVFGDEIVYERYTSNVKASVAIDVAPYLNRWIHLVTTYDSASLRMYIDGVEVRIKPDARPQQTIDGNFWIGCDEELNSGVVKGDLDEVAVYDKALSAARVKAHYDMGHGPF